MIKCKTIKYLLKLILLFTFQSVLETFFLMIDHLTSFDLYLNEYKDMIKTFPCIEYIFL